MTAEVCHLCRSPLIGPPIQMAERVRWDKPALWAVRDLCSPRCVTIWRANTEMERLRRASGYYRPGGAT